MRIPVSVLCLLAGCGVYAVRLDPPPERLPVAAPLDATVSLGAVRTLVDGVAMPGDAAAEAALDEEFVRAASAASLVQAALPRGSHTDLYLDVTRHLHQVTGVRDVLYGLLAGPLPFVVPGFPYPRRYRVGRDVVLRGEVAGASMPLCTHEQRYEQQVWGRAIGARESEPEIRKRCGTDWA